LIKAGSTVRIYLEEALKHCQDSFEDRYMVKFFNFYARDAVAV
jgi:hypothetical protein